MDKGASMFILSSRFLESLLAFQFLQIHKEIESFRVSEGIGVVDPLIMNHFADSQFCDLTADRSWYIRCIDDFGRDVSRRCVAADRLLNGTDQVICQV